jgi:putative protein-disulfide isomerase
MCGWCYAFGGVVDELQQRHGDFFDFVAVSGGMIVGDRIGPISGMRDFLKTAIPRVEEYTGVQFGERYKALVEEGSYVLNSIKPAIALAAFKSMLPFRSVEFAHDMQFEHFYNGMDLNEKEIYLALAANYNIDGEELLKRMNDERFHKYVQEDFEYVKQVGITGFPCVLGETAKGLYMLANGYSNEERMEQILQAFRNKIEEGEPEMEPNTN